MLSEQNISSTSLSEDNKRQGMFQRENDSKAADDDNSDSFTDCEDVTQIQIILALPENSVNEDNIVAECDNTEVILNEPLQNKLIQDDMKAQITNFEDKPTENNVSEQLSTKIKENEEIVLNNTQVKKNFDEVVDRFTRALQSPNSVKSETQNVPKENVITSDKADESKSMDVDYNNTTQDSKGESEKSNDNLVVSCNTDDKIVQCPVDGNVTNLIKNENEIQYFGRDLPSQEQKYELNASENVPTLTNIDDSSDEESSPKKSRQFTFSDSDLPNDDEIREILMMYPKPKFIEPFSESESESSLEDESNRPICRRRRYKPKPLDLKKMIEKLPKKVLTRLRKQPDRFGIVNIKNNSAILKPTYLKEQEDQIDENVIIENIKRFKTFRKRKSKSDSTTLKSVKEDGKDRSLRKRTKKVNKRNVHKNIKKAKPKGKNAKSNYNARLSCAANKKKNTKDKRRREAVAISAAKITITRTRSMAKENDSKDLQNKRVFLRNRNHKTNSKQILTNMKVRTRLAENKERRSKRQQNAKQKIDDTVKAPISILMKSTHEQSTVISSSSSKSPKGLKRSLVHNSDVPSPKRTRLQNTNNNKEIKNNNSRVEKTQHGHVTAFHNKELLQDKRGPFVYLEKYEPTQKQIRMLKSNRNSFTMLKRNSNRTSLKMKTRAQSAPRRTQRACQRTRVGGAKR